MLIMLVILYMHKIYANYVVLISKLVCFYFNMYKSKLKFLSIIKCYYLIVKLTY